MPDYTADIYGSRQYYGDEHKRSLFQERGVSGLYWTDGYVYEEFLPQLRVHEYLRVYKEMSYNDPVIGAILYTTEQLVRKVRWKVKPASDRPADVQAAQFVEDCIGNLDFTWEDIMTEILSMFVYGWSWQEILYTINKQGQIVWKNLSPRAQSTWWEWHFDFNGDILGMWQLAPPYYDYVYLPKYKSLHFRTKSVRNNPEGRSLLRNAYRPWYFKKRIEEIEGIGIERDLAGLPVLIPPEEVDIWNTDDQDASRARTQAEAIVRNTRRDKNEGIVLPHGWEFKLLSTGSSRQFDTNAIINRYDQRIAITLLSDIVMLGADKVGSFALANVKKSLLSSSLESQLRSIASVLNKEAVRRLINMNYFPGITGYPILVPSEVETPDLKELGLYLNALSRTGIPLFPDDDLENYLRQVASMPLKSNLAKKLRDPYELDKESYLVQMKELYEHYQIKQPFEEYMQHMEYMYELYRGGAVPTDQTDQTEQNDGEAMVAEMYNP